MRARSAAGIDPDQSVAAADRPVWRTQRMPDPCHAAPHHHPDPQSRPGHRLYCRRVVHTHKIRTGDDHLDPGGGGINVARVLHELGGDTLAVMMAGGVTGALIEEMLDEARVPRQQHADPRLHPHLLHRVRDARPSWNTASSGGTGRHRRRLARACWSVLEAIAVRVADRQRQPGAWHAGGHLCARGASAAQAARAALRTGHLRTCVACGVGQRHRDDQAKPGRTGNAGRAHAAAMPHEQEAEALALVRAGAARLVAVTLGEDGAFVASAEGVIRLAALPCEVRSAVGAGDSFTAAMALALARGKKLAGSAGAGAWRPAPPRWSAPARRASGRWTWRCNTSD